MSVAKEAMYAALREAGTVTAVVGRKIWPDQAAQDRDGYTVNPPWLVFQEVAAVRRATFRGVSGVQRSRFQLTGYCETRARAEQLKEALLGLLNGKFNQTFGGLQVQASIVGESDGVADEDEAPRPGEEFGDRVVRLDVLWCFNRG